MSSKNSFTLDPSLPKPLYRQLADEMLARIHLGEYETGRPLPPINKLENMVNASRITVVKALKELSSRGIITAHGKRGYFVNSRKDPTYVGFVVPLHTVYMSIYSRMHASLQLAVRRRQGSLVVVSSKEDPRVFEDRITEMVLGQGIHKLAVVPPSGPRDEVHPDAIKTLRKISALPDVRMVVMDRTIEPDGYSVLSQNYESGYRQAITLLAGRGYGRILVLNAPPPAKDACAAIGNELNGITILWQNAAPLSQQIMEQVLAVAADAVIMYDLPAALLLEHFGSLPFAIIGYNGSDFVDACPVRMTCVDSNLKEMGRTACEILESGQNYSRTIDPSIRLGDTTPDITKQ